MSENSKMFLTKSIIIRGLNQKQYDVLVDVSSKLNELRNCAVEITKMFKASDGRHYEKTNYKSIISRVKTEFKKEYSITQASISNAVIKKHVESFNSYIALTNKKIDGKYDRKVNKPKKHDTGRLHNIIIPQNSITSSKKKLEEGYIELPLSKAYKKTMKDKSCRPRIKIPEDIRDKKFIQVEIIPIDNGKMFKANFTYEMEIEPWDLNENNVMGIDLGVNNFATIVTSEGTPYIVDGRFLKNQIYFKCKKVAHYMSILNKQGLKTSKRIQKINTKFQGKEKNFLNQTVHFILQQCLEQNIGTIILGYNKNFQFKSNMGRKQNQIFTSIAFKKFKEKLETQYKKHEITLILQEESYTSKSSFLDDDILPVYDPSLEEKPKYKFKGIREERGLYKTQDKKYINADVNAAANIIKKRKHEFNYERLYKWVQTAPIKIKLQT